jgi:hypothetical protein
MAPNPRYPDIRIGNGLNPEYPHIRIRKVPNPSYPDFRVSRIRILFGAKLFGRSSTDCGLIRIEIGGGTGALTNEAGTAGVVPRFIRSMLCALAKIYPQKRISLWYEYMLIYPVSH